MLRAPRCCELIASAPLSHVLTSRDGVFIERSSKPSVLHRSSGTTRLRETSQPHRRYKSADSGAVVNPPTCLCPGWVI
ncbi:hypothetical protein CCR75_007750 [Bremia lactucae]|uniref:Uncharacterized protein n=1 Tax=Bremia lactucae TaxID=4779 RepID=A0A976IC31_BRELC|nr:hypothetical protein CCR75_007750 [Bremia lactucae]